jgi:hypothetical protein
MFRRIAVFLAAAVLALTGFSVSQASAAEFFGQDVSTGSIVQTVVTEGDIRLEGFRDLTVGPCGANGVVSATAWFHAGTSPVPVQVTICYRNSNNWTVTVVRDVPVGTPSLEINNVEGTITKANGTVSVQLMLRKYVLGGGQIDMNVSIDQTGLVANALVENLTIGGLVLTSASITVSSAARTAELTASLQTNAGNFFADITAERIGVAPSYQWTLDILVTGADLVDNAGNAEIAEATSEPRYTLNDLGLPVSVNPREKEPFQFNQFRFQARVTTAGQGCTSINADVTGTATISTTPFNFSGRIVISCSTAEVLEVTIVVPHYTKWLKTTESVTLSVSWYGTPGTYTPPFGSRIRYASGWFGTADLSHTRDLGRQSKKVAGIRRYFESRTVTVGLYMAVTVYKPSTGSAFTGGAAVGGYFHAHRVSGDVSCGYLPEKWGNVWGAFRLLQKNDFLCGGTLHWDPSWAGKYDIPWGGF